MIETEMWTKPLDANAVRRFLIERRRALLMELAGIEDYLQIPRTVPKREERRPPSVTLTTDMLQK